MRPVSHSEFNNTADYCLAHRRFHHAVSFIREDDQHIDYFATVKGGSFISAQSVPSLKDPSVIAASFDVQIAQFEQFERQ